MAIIPYNGVIIQPSNISDAERSAIERDCKITAGPTPTEWNLNKCIHDTMQKASALKPVKQQSATAPPAANQTAIPYTGIIIRPSNVTAAEKALIEADCNAKYGFTSLTPNEWELNKCIHDRMQELSIRKASQQSPAPATPNSAPANTFSMTTSGSQVDYQNLVNQVSQAIAKGANTPAEVTIIVPPGITPLEVDLTRKACLSKHERADRTYDQNVVNKCINDELQLIYAEKQKNATGASNTSGSAESNMVPLNPPAAKDNTGLIIGCVFGGLLVTVGVIAFIRKRNSKKVKNEKEAA